MSMLDSLRSKLGIDPEADSYVDDTEENVFPGGQGAAAAAGVYPAAGDQTAQQ